MTSKAHSIATGALLRPLLSAAVLVGLVLTATAPLAQAPADPAASSMSRTSPPLEAYTDPGWTGRPQAPAVQRKEAAAALAEGRQRCGREPAGQARKACMELVAADYRLMLSRIETRRVAR